MESSGLSLASLFPRGTSELNSFEVNEGSTIRADAGTLENEAIPRSEVLRYVAYMVYSLCVVFTLVYMLAQLD